MNQGSAPGVITITTDFGHKGPFAAVMKGVILQHLPNAKVVDLAHDIPAHWPPEAGFWISRSYQYFPVGSVHVAIVDPGVGTEREIILANYDGHVFLAPDNGLLAPILDRDGCNTYQLASDKLAKVGIVSPSLTFHGRDIFAPVAAEIAAGRLSIEDIAAPASSWTPGWLEEPDTSAGHISGVIVTVDAFGNLISNIDKSLVATLQHPTAHIAGHDFAMSATYGRVAPGDYLALINSFDVLEIARSEGSAAESLGADRGAPITVREKDC